MSQLLKNPLSNSTILTKFYFSNNHYKYNPTLIPKFAVFLNPSNPPFQKLLFLSRNRQFHLKAYDSSSFDLQESEKSNLLFNFDALLSVLESLCVVSSLVIAMGCVVNGVLFKQQNSGLVIIGNRLLVWLLAGSVAVGSVIRRRQWRRFCGPVRVNSGPGLGLEAGNMIERIEKLEESMKSATTIIRMLSRQLEKLGVRFRVMRKALRDPITETAALAQKNSEATRALSVQEDILEKELAEVQKVLLAMQDQQQKQLELILAIAKSGKLLETKQAPAPASGVHENDSADRGLRRADDQHVQAIVGQSGAISEKALGS